MIIRPSSTPRAFNCLGSIGMEAQASDLPDTDDAREGTAAHWVAEMVLKGEVGDVSELIDRPAPNEVIVTGEMVEHVQTYVDTINERDLSACVEHPIEFDLDGATVKGTADHFAYGPDDTLYVDDLKYGWRAVDPENNWQLLSYAVGASQFYPHLQSVVMTIHQPRPHHPLGKVRGVTITRDELLAKVQEMRAIVQRIQSGDRTLTTGKHCDYCPAAVFCPAHQQSGMNAVDVSVQGVPDHLTPEALASELRILKRAEEMIKARASLLDEQASTQIKQGKFVPGWGLNHRYGKRRWKDGVATLEMLSGKKLTEDKPITPAAAERLGIDKDIVAMYAETPVIGTKLEQVDLDKQMKGLFGNG